MVMNNRLDILWREPNGLGHYYKYWLNYCDGDPKIVDPEYIWRLKLDWQAVLMGSISGDVPYLQFATEEDKTLFILRYA